MAKVDIKSIDSLYNLTFYVPSYQRGFRWSSIQMQELLDDLYNFCEYDRQSDDDYYCLQPIIVKKREDSWELVDGQQRLTAFWIMSALYYNARKMMGRVTRETYSLIYEEKDVFTNLLNRINELVVSGEMVNLENELDSLRAESIDSKYLIDAISVVLNYTIGEDNYYGILQSIFRRIKQIKIIWYVLDEEENPIQTFANINANKIELTNSELIKASLLQAFSGKKDLQDGIAFQWEDIEKKLNDNRFWNFIINESRGMIYQTRIDFLFELWCFNRFEDSEQDNDDRYHIFRMVNKEIGKSKDAPIDMWNAILQMFEILQDWYTDYFYYHGIGLLISINEKNNDVGVVARLYRDYIQMTKRTFEAHVLEQIQKAYFSDSKATPFSKLDPNEIVNDLAEIYYSDKKIVKNVLLLYNIALLLTADNKYEWFPFELFKHSPWDIEHINPQTPKEMSTEDKIAWLESYKRVITDSTLHQKLDDCINNISTFEEVAREVNEMLNIDDSDNDNIGNLVLLDAKLNRAYKNECFAIKRDTIVRIERTAADKNDVVLIPVGTKWVFLKEYEGVDNLRVWSKPDMSEYIHNMADSIYKMLVEKESK